MYLTQEQMQKLSTKRLLAYKKKKLSMKHELKCTSWCNCFYVGDYETCEKNCGKSTLEELMNFKEAYDSIKKILATREHVK